MRVENLPFFFLVYMLGNKSSGDLPYSQRNGSTNTLVLVSFMLNERILTALETSIL